MSKLKNRITAVLVLAFMGIVFCLTLRNVVIDGKGINGETSAGNTFRVSETAERLSSVITENIAGKDILTGINANIRNEVGEGIVNGVLASGDRLLYVNDSERVISPGIAKQLNLFAENYEGALYFAAIPTSSGVYGEKLPAYIDKNSEFRRINELYEKLGNNIRNIDACNILKTHMNNYIYYRSDTKWTGYGAYCVYRTIAQKLGFTPSVYDKYTIRHLSSEFRGNLYTLTGFEKVEADMIDAYDYSGGAKVTSCIGYNSDGSTFESALYDKTLLDSDYMYDVYLGRETEYLRIKTSVSNERKLLVIKDSYGDCLVPFLTQHYSEIDVVSVELTEDSIREHVNPDNYEQTLIILGIESLSDDTILEMLNR